VLLRPLTVRVPPRDPRRSPATYPGPPRTVKRLLPLPRRPQVARAGGDDQGGRTDGARAKSARVSIEQALPGREKRQVYQTRFKPRAPPAVHSPTGFNAGGACASTCNPPFPPKSWGELPPKRGEEKRKEQRAQERSSFGRKKNQERQELRPHK